MHQPNGKTSAGRDCNSEANLQAVGSERNRSMGSPTSSRNSNGITSMEHMFCRKYVINKSVNRDVLDGVRRQRMYEMDDIKHMFRTSIWMDWDQRKSFRLQETDVDDKNVEEGVQDGCFVYEAVKCERSLDRFCAKKSKGISKLRSNGRYKFSYTVHEKEVLRDLLDMERREQSSVANEECCAGEEVLNVPDVPDVDVPDVEVNQPHGNEEDDEVECERTENESKRKPKGRCTILKKLRERGMYGGNVNRRKRKSRKRIDSDRFKLMDTCRRRVESNRLRNDKEVFTEACRVGKIVMHHMDQEWVEVPHLRCVHVKENTRRFVSVCSSRVRKMMASGERTEVATLCLMSENKSKEVRCINVKERRLLSRSGRLVRKEEIVSCSCDLRRVNGIIVMSKCIHTKLLNSEDNVFMRSIRELLSNGFSNKESTENEEFGQWINVKRNAITVGDEEEDAVIGTQIDQEDGRGLTERGRNIKKRWSCWNTFDVNDEIFVCCLRVALGTGIKVTKVKCMQCRSISQKKCRHESACIKVLSDSGTVNVNENGELQEAEPLGGEDGETKRTFDSASEYSSSELDFDDEGESERKVTQVSSGAGESGTEEVGVASSKCMFDPKHWFASRKRRPLFMCPSERLIALQLTEQIESWNRTDGGLCYVDPDGWYCGGKIKDGKGAISKCTATKTVNCTRYPRKITVFTLNHDLLSIVVTDWVCSKCRFENRFSGEAHGIFPASKHRAFTVELLYFWLHESTGRGISFRSIFELTSNLQNTPSYRRRIDCGILDVLAPEFERDRRLANKALRVFCRNIALGDADDCTREIFSCTKCERPLTASDCKQLGVKAQVANGMKRFRSLVMDGKVIGSLREFPIDSGTVHTLVGTKGLPSKIVNNRPCRSALVYFTKSVRRMVRSIQYGRGTQLLPNLCAKDGKVYMRLGAMIDVKGVTKGNIDSFCRIARWFCDDGSCLCNGNKWTASLHHEQCVTERHEMHKTDGCTLASRMLSKMFAITCYQGEGGSVVTVPTLNCHGTRMDSDLAWENASSHSADDMSDDDSVLDITGRSDEQQNRNEDDVVEVKNQWVMFKVVDAFKCTEVLELLMENVQFVLGEPISLGLLPFFTHQHDEEGDTNTEDTTMSDSSTPAVLEAVSESVDIMWTEWSRRYIQVLHGTSDDGRPLFENDYDCRKKAIDLLTEETEQSHKGLSTVLHTFSDCEHGNTSTTSFPCPKCSDELEAKGEAMEQQNSVVCSFINEVIRVGRRAPLLSRTGCGILHELIDAKLSSFDDYKKEAAAKMDPSVARYWRQYGHFAEKKMVDSVADVEGRNESHSTFVFPGRTYVRPPIKTDGKDKADCTKKYGTSRPDMTSFISLQCPCEHPKIIGFSLIKECESIAMAISTVLAFLNFPPRTLWYDNACNLYDSVLLRTPFVLRSCYFIVDRFHFQGHTCSNHYNPGRYKSLLEQRSVAAEVLNSVVDRSAGFIRYLHGENVRPFLRVMFALHNFHSMVKDRLNRRELPLMDIGRLYNDQFPCNCVLCQVQCNGPAWDHTTRESVTFLPIYGSAAPDVQAERNAVDATVVDRTDSERNDKIDEEVLNEASDDTSGSSPSECEERATEPAS